MKDQLLQNFFKKSPEVFSYQKVTEKSLNWIRTTAFTLEKYYYTCIFTDVTKEYTQKKEIKQFLKTNIEPQKSMACKFSHAI